MRYLTSLLHHSLRRLVPVALFGAVLVVTAGAQVTLAPSDPSKDGTPEKYRPKWSAARDYTPAFIKKALATDPGQMKYLRTSVHDGNLIETGFANQGLLSYAYIPGQEMMMWPKGSGTAYGHTFDFFVAAEVTGNRGDTLQIVSDSYRRSNVEISPDGSHWMSWTPLPKYFNNHHPSSQDWDMGGISEDVGVDGIPNTGDAGEGDGVLQPQEDFNGNGKLDVSMLNVVEYCAMSHRKETWPTHWPIGSFSNDTRLPGQENVASLRDGRWNGQYGAYVRADQESYYKMDDRENDEFDYNAFTTQPGFPWTDSLANGFWPRERKGLGLTVEVRGYQWAARLAEDILILICDITNNGKDLKKSVVGMYCDADLGGSLEGDNASFDFKDDITYAWSEGDLSNLGLPLGYFGFAFLESPGLDHDGVDNDQDGMVDESQWNDIDENHNWITYTDLNLNGHWDSGEPMNDDVGSDGIGPEMEDYTGPDPDGTEGNGKPDQGEPHFGKTDNAESDQVGLTSFYLVDCQNIIQDDKKFWFNEIPPGTHTVVPGFTRDITWTYGSGFVELNNGRNGTMRYAIACLFGNDFPDIFRNKRTMQVIYDNDYNFSKPPRKPYLTAMGGDQKVGLMWDDGAERSIDPVYGNDFEAYMIYKSTDVTFSDIKTISDGFGNPLLYKPLAIFDLHDGLAGMHPIRLGSELGEGNDLGVSYNMGEDSGLRHSYVDTAVTNGRTYYYALVSLDKGYATDFYARGLSTHDGLQSVSPTESGATIQTDALGRPISWDRNVAIVVPSERVAGYVGPSLDKNGVQHTAGMGSGTVTIQEFPAEYMSQPGSTYELTFVDDSTYQTLSGSFFGRTRHALLNNVTTGKFLADVSFPDTAGQGQDLLFEGFKLRVTNQDTIKVTSSGWKTGQSNLGAAFLTNEAGGTAVPRDYEIRVMTMGADSSLTKTPVNFQVWDVTYPGKEFQVDFRFTDKTGTATADRGVLSDGDRVMITSEKNRRLWVVDFKFADTLAPETRVAPAAGDVYAFKTIKPFDRNDHFTWSVVGNNINASKATSELSNIYTVPDPYVAASSLERFINNTELGRGDRRIDFVNLPQECTITIFTTSGRMVRRLTHTATQNEGRESWDLRTKDGLEVSHGVYMYVVESPGLGKKIGKLAIIK